MPRARSPDSIEAERLWKEEKLLLKEIAAKLGVPEGTVRRWKNTQDWEGKKSERSGKGNAKKANVLKRKKGGQKGNGNAQKHGAYSKSRWDFLDEEERAWLGGNMTDDAEKMYLEEIAMFTIRERRIMTAINKYRKPLVDAEGREKAQDVYISGSVRTETKRRFKNAEEEEEYNERIKKKVKNGDRLPGEQYTLHTQTAPTAELIARLERELSTVQRSKTAAITALKEYRAEKRKLEGDSAGNDALHAWAEAVRQKREERKS